MNSQHCLSLAFVAYGAFCLAEFSHGSMAKFHSGFTALATGTLQAKTGSLKPHAKFKAEVQVKSPEQGGRRTPFFRGYRPTCYFGTTDVTGTVTALPEGVDMAKPGDKLIIEFELASPVDMEKSTTFVMREGGKTVGEGVVTETID